jgi:hypothetical protein
MRGTATRSSAGASSKLLRFKTDSGENLVDAKEPSSISDALDDLAKVEPKLAELVVTMRN